MEEQKKQAEAAEKLAAYGVELVGMGHEKIYNRKTMIVKWDRKWHHFYGDTYERCLKKALKKIKKKKERVQCIKQESR